MNKQAFEQGFMKAAMALGLNYYEAAALYKTADGTSWDFLKATMHQPGASDAAWGEAQTGGIIGGLGGGLAGALSADETKGQSKWKRGFGGALAGGGLGALAGGGMKVNQLFDSTKDLVGQQQIDYGRNALGVLQQGGDLPPELQSQILQKLKDNRAAGEQVRGFNMTDALTGGATNTVKNFFNGALTDSTTTRK